MILLLGLGLLAGAFLALALISLPLLLRGAGPLTAVQRPDLLAVCGHADPGRAAATVIATRRYVFVVWHQALPTMPDLLAWYGGAGAAGGPTAATLSDDAFEALCRSRLSDPRTTVAEVERAHGTLLPREAALELARLVSYRVGVERSDCGFHWVEAMGGARFAPIESPADALALQRFLGAGR